jgi:hypothetical protein
LGRSGLCGRGQSLGIRFQAFELCFKVLGWAGIMGMFHTPGWRLPNTDTLT